MPKTFIRVTLDNDPDTENPLNYDSSWTLHTFANHMYTTDCDPHLYIKPNAKHIAIPANRALRDKLKSGLAHWVSRYKHSGTEWGLVGEVHQCRWDTTQIAGILIWERPWRELGTRDYEKRKQDARVTLGEYTRWVNGDCYWYKIEKFTVDDPDFDPEYDDIEDFADFTGPEIELASCGGFIGAEYVAGEIRRELEGVERDGIIVTGDAK